MGQERAAATAQSKPDDRPALHAVGARGRRAAIARLSRKELLVLTELARGGSTESIAQTLYVSPHTVRTHVKNILRKLEANSRAHAVAIAMNARAIDL